MGGVTIGIQREIKVLGFHLEGEISGEAQCAAAAGQCGGVYRATKYLKEKEITEDEERRGQDLIQQLTDNKVKQIDSALEAKEADLMEI